MFKFLKHRMNRASYWMGLVVVVVGISTIISIGGHSGNLEVIMLFIGIPRLHDIGRSGWLVGAAIAIELVVVIGAAASGLDILTAGGLYVLVLAIFAIWLGVIRGDAEANKWGDPPPAGILFWKSNRVD